MRTIRWTVRSILCISLLSVMPVVTRASDAPDKVQARFFEEKIRPVLIDRCYGCHSVEKGKSKGGLLLDTREGLLKGGEKGPAIVAGDPEKSLLIKAIRQVTEDFSMPPDDKLSPQLIADFEQWIKNGAYDPRKKIVGVQKAATVGSNIDFEFARKFWSFQPVKDPAPPAVKTPGWSKSPIDLFVLSKLEEKKLKPAPAAAKLMLIRRATFDLTGLPPTPDEIDMFVYDDSPDAFERVVDRLLASPHYGERWGRHWLDVARYADTGGDSADYPIPQAYKYRNYVIDAFNADTPYDQFVRQQIAGDLLPAASEEERYRNIIATGFVAISKRFSVRPESDVHLTIDDTLDTTSRAMLGLTLSCARCHDHKFDPIPQQDYYSLYGILGSTKYPFGGSEENKRPYDFTPLTTKERVEKEFAPYEKKIAEIDANLKRLEKEKEALERMPNNLEKGAKLLLNKTVREKSGRDRKELYENPPKIELAYAVFEGEGKNTKLKKRGEQHNPGDEVPRRFLQILGGQKLSDQTIEKKGSGRLDLANWLADPKNPLTARVMANRIWQNHFGNGIVATSSDFGKQGSPPTHPELLDWLAARFVEDGWSIKKLHKRIMLSQVYQLASDGPAESLAVDPNNEFVWRHSRRRLDAESIRDAMLFVSGNLDLSRGGQHPFVPRHKWEYSQHNPFNAVYETNKRSVYLMQQRIKKHPFLALFDGADSNTPTAVRAYSTSPIQALFMMNDPFTHEQGEIFARRMLREEPNDVQRVKRATRLAFGREATEEEVARGVNFVELYRQRSKSTALPLDQIEPLALGAYLRVMLASNEFVHVE